MAVFERGWRAGMTVSFLFCLYTVFGFFGFYFVFLSACVYVPLDFFLVVDSLDCHRGKNNQSKAQENAREPWNSIDINTC